MKPSSTAPKSELWLFRHGETEWSANGRHTGLTDIPLTPEGVRQGECLGRWLQGRAFSLVLTSPLRRARDTCTIAGYGADAIEDADLSEWDYGGYEGRTGTEIRAEQPGWEIWRDGVPGGETVEEVGLRVDRAITRARSLDGKVAFFAHSHLLRVLAARWLDLTPASGRLFVLDTASVSILGYDRDRCVVRRWNDVQHLTPGSSDRKDEGGGERRP